MTSSKVLGINGETIATRYLEARQYVILNRNIRFGRDELDIVAYDRSERMIVFVEVKTRTSHSEAYPIRSALTIRKKRCLQRAMSAWCIAHEYDGPARLDVICVHKEKIVEHLREIGREFLD